MSSFKLSVISSTQHSAVIVVEMPSSSQLRNSPNPHASQSRSDLSLGSNDRSNLARIVALEMRQERLEMRQDKLENFIKDIVQRLTNARP